MIPILFILQNPTKPLAKNPLHIFIFLYTVHALLNSYKILIKEQTRFHIQSLLRKYSSKNLVHG